MLVQVNFTYTAIDAGVPQPQVIFGSITISVVEALVANNDTATVTSGGSVTIDVLANDTGGTGPYNISTITQPGPGKGTATVTGAGNINYTAPAAFAGMVS